MSPLTPIGEPFMEIGEVDSSNNYAMRQVQAQLAEHGATYFASFQTQGKGQRGKNWVAEPGQNIMMSCVLEPHLLNIDNKFVLSCCIALACFDFFNEMAIDNTSIKWPNDIYWGDRKAGGILVENVLQGKEWKYAIVGIGININQTLFSPNLPNPVSLRQITGKSFDSILLAKDLCTHLESRWKMLLGGQMLDLMNQYNACLYKLNQTVWFRKHNAVYAAVIKGVNNCGELLADTGNLSAIPHGDVEWLIG